MIELSLLPSQPVLHCLPAPAEIGDPEGFDFAAQLALTTCVMPRPSGAAPGKALPQPGTALPVVLDPEISEDPEPEPELAPLPAVPIMRPILPQLKFAGVSSPDFAPVASPAPTETDANDEPTATAAKAMAEAVVPGLALAPIAVPAAPLPVATAAVPRPHAAQSAPIAAASVRGAEVHPVAAQAQGENSPPALPDGLARTTPIPHGAVQPATPLARNRLTNLRRASEDAPVAQPTPLRTAAPILPVALPPALALAAGVPARRGFAAVKQFAGSENVAVPVPQVKLAAAELPHMPQFTAPTPIPMMADVSAVAAQNTAAPFGQTAPAPIAQDFAALIDRIVAAREASGAPVAVAVRHAEFGAVTLRFEQGDSGIAVSATSPDPDFARAALAAMPAERPAGFDQAPREGGKPSAQPEGQSSGNQSGQPRHSAATAQTAATARTTALVADTDADDTGIFA